MDQLIPILGMAALLGSAVVGGVFLAFSGFIMKALARMPGPGGTTAMQLINVAVITPAFLGPFLGTAVLSLGMMGFALLYWGRPWSMFLLAGGLLYITGVLLVTLFRNVPLNDSLAAVSSSDPVASDMWDNYLRRWTRSNHIRTGAALAAALLFGIGLVQAGAL